MAVSVRDPVHGSIPLDDWVIPLIDSPAFQRLRRIQQLGTAHLVYPGANHRRFEHSIGAHHLAGRLAKQLRLGGQDALTLRAAALVHDIGHGPFSHAFEEIQHHSGQRHEQTTVDLVRWGPLADLMRQGDIDPVAVSEAVVGEGPLSGIVSGALDADRMDYLLRDAHYTGVRVTVDPDRLMRVTERDDEHGIIIRESGVLSAEALLTTRFLMYPAVYLHHTVRASERMLQEAIRAHLEDGHATFKELERETDDGLLHRLRQAGGVGAEMVQRLDDRRLYKRAYTGMPDRFDDATVARMRDDHGEREKVAAEIAQTAGVEPHEVLLDVPKPPKFRESNLWVRRRDGSSTPIRDASSLIRILADARLDHWRFWVFAPRPHQKAVTKAAEQVLGPSPSGPTERGAT